VKNKSIKILKKFKNKWRKIYKILITNNIEEKVSKILQIYLRKKNVILFIKTLNYDINQTV